MRWMVCAFAAVPFFLFLACGTTDANAPQVGPSSGVSPGDDASPPRTLADLTLAERKKLCDWTANRGGGYGKTQVCDGGLVVKTVASQSACIDQYLGACTTVTVTEWEACRNAEVAAPCSLPLFTAPECLVVRRCIGLTDGGPPPEPGDGG